MQLNLTIRDPSCSRHASQLPQSTDALKKKLISSSNAAQPDYSHTTPYSKKNASQGSPTGAGSATCSTSLYLVMLACG
jgi:hypothetical protein